MSIVKLNNRGVRSVTTFGSLSSGSMTFIKKLTASSSSTLSFVDGSSDVVLDNTYKEYLFTFKDIHPATDNVDFEFQGSTDSGSNYNTTMTTTTFRGQGSESDTSDYAIGYRTGEDQAQGTAFQDLNIGMGADNDQALSGTLHLFNPSSTTFVKHFIARVSSPKANEYNVDWFCAGYFNTTSAIDAMQFKMSSGNIDAGDICLYGIN
jgi:hypothetical protein|tara:strand:+ start:602 stop:1222 length:621 start_codon:yes stop_codon:yes gene_type:complete